MEGNRKSCFNQLRHKNACSIDDLKLKLRKLYIQELKTKREKILNDKREITVSEEDDLDFYKNFCKDFFGKYEDPWEADEDLLNQIWEEILLEEREKDETDLLESLLEHSMSHQIICPVCLRLPARMKDSSVECQCGFHFPLPPHITLKDFETAVITSSEFHNLSCDAVAEFHLKTCDNNVLQFTSSCENCQMMSVIFEATDGIVIMEDE